MEEINILKTEKWLNTAEIDALLEGVSFIILAQPNMDERSPSRIHISIFFHTPEAIPEEIVPQVLEKISHDYHLTDIIDFKYSLGDVAFAKTNEPTPMPYHLPSKLEGDHSLEEGDTVKMFLFDFDANASEGFENVAKSMTGWTYVKEH